MANNELNTIIDGCSICVVGGGGVQTKFVERLQVQKRPSGFLKSLGMSLDVAGSNLGPSLGHCSCQLWYWGEGEVSGWKNPKPLWSPESQRSWREQSRSRGGEGKGQGVSWAGQVAMWVCAQAWASLWKGGNAQLSIPCASLLQLSSCRSHWCR